MSKILTFLRETKIELSKVSWPTRSQVIKYTLIVIGLSLALAAYLGLLDFAFAYILQRFVIR